MAECGTDKLAQQQEYAKCKAWASHCGLTDDEFDYNLKAVPTEQHQRGRASLPTSLHLKNATHWEHARLLCVSSSIHRIAADAGRRLGGETLATQAAAEVSECLSSESHRLSRVVEIPLRWQGDRALRMPSDSPNLTSGIKPLPGFFEMWLRAQAAGLMGQHAEEKWRTLVRQTDESMCLQLEGLSQQFAARQHQSPSQFVLDGATCKRAPRPHPVATA